MHSAPLWPSSAHKRLKAARDAALLGYRVWLCNGKLAARDQFHAVSQRSVGLFCNRRLLRPDIKTRQNQQQLALRGYSHCSRLWPSFQCSPRQGFDPAGCFAAATGSRGRQFGANGFGRGHPWPHFWKSRSWRQINIHLLIVDELLSPATCIMVPHRALLALCSVVIRRQIPLSRRAADCRQPEKRTEFDHDHTPTSADEQVNQPNNLRSDFHESSIIDRFEGLISYNASADRGDGLLLGRSVGIVLLSLGIEPGTTVPGLRC